MSDSLDGLPYQYLDEQPKSSSKPRLSIRSKDRVRGQRSRTVGNTLRRMSPRGFAALPVMSGKGEGRTHTNIQTRKTIGPGVTGAPTPAY